MRCCNPECPRPDEHLPEVGGQWHMFSGYELYVRYHAACCPGNVDGTNCDDDHPPGWQPDHWENSDDIEILDDRRVVWVNGGPTGGALGRFGLNGIDVHSKTTDACLHCTHEPTTAADWDVFVAKMWEHHEIFVSDLHKPERFQ